MARIRTIKPEFWTDKKIIRLSRDARLFFIGLWNFADDNGVLEADPLQLKAWIFPVDPDIGIEEIEKFLDELKKLELIQVYEVNGTSYIWIKNFNKHQKIDRPRKSNLPLPPEENKEETFQLKSSEISRNQLKSSEIIPGKEKEKEIEKDQGKEKEENKEYFCSVSSANADETRTAIQTEPPPLLPKGLILSTLKETPKEKRYRNEDIAIRLPIKGDKSYKEILLTHNFVNELKELFPAVDVEACLKKMYAWLLANEKRQKTKQGIKKFITTWLSKEQDRATRSRTSPSNGTKPKYAMTLEEFQKQLWKREEIQALHAKLQQMCAKGTDEYFLLAAETETRARLNEEMRQLFEAGVLNENEAIQKLLERFSNEPTHIRDVIKQCMVRQ